MKLFSRLFKPKEASSSKFFARSNSHRSNSHRSNDETTKSSDHSDVRGSTKSKVSSRSRRSKVTSRSSTKSKKNGRVPIAKVEVQMTREANALRTAEKLMTVMNDYNPAYPQAYIDAFCDLYQDGKQGKVLAEDGDAHTAEQCATLLTFVHNACPSDYKLQHTQIMQQDKDHFTIMGVSPCGTFDGAPLTIMPGVLPTVPPTGKFVSLGEEHYRCLMNEDGTKIVHVEVIAMGNLTGFAGFYEACGGSLTPPKP